MKINLTVYVLSKVILTFQLLAHISPTVKKEITDDLKFKKDKILNKLDLVSREEFEILKKIVQKQDLQIRKLQKNKKIKKVKKP